MIARRGTLGEWHSTPPVEKEKGEGTSIEDEWEGGQPETRKEKLFSKHQLCNVSAYHSVPIYFGNAAQHRSTKNNVSCLGNDLH